MDVFFFFFCDEGCGQFLFFGRPSQSPFLQSNMSPPLEDGPALRGDENKATTLEAIIYVNGSRHVLPAGRGDATLLQYLRGEKKEKTPGRCILDDRRKKKNSLISSPLLSFKKKKKKKKQDDLRLTGTKLVCGEGGCGACTVTLVDRDTAAGEIRARPVNACLFPLYAAEGAAVVTVEGLSPSGGGGGSGFGGGGRGSDGGEKLHPLPAALANAHGSQCGFCSPGFVMAAHSCLASHAVRAMRQKAEDGEGGRNEGGGVGGGTKGAGPAAAAAAAAAAAVASSSSSPSCPQQRPAEDIEDVFSGNLCRCTGYRPIVDAFRPFFFDENGEEKREGEGGASASAGGRCFAAPARPGEEEEEGEASSSSSRPTVVDASSLLPRELLMRPKPELFFPAANDDGGGVEWHRPTSLRSLLSHRAAAASRSSSSPCTLVGGNTEVGIECAQKGARHAVRVDVGSVPELAVLDFGTTIRSERGGEEGEEEGEIIVGAGATLEEVLEAAKGSSPSSGAASALAAQLRRFAGRAVRAAAVVAGNVVTASPASDLNPVFVACGALFDLARLSGEEENSSSPPSSSSRAAAAAAAPSTTIAVRSVPAAEFFTGYRQVDLAPEEVLLRVRLPRWGGDGGVAADCTAAAAGASAAGAPPSPPLRRRRPLDFVQAFKQARRRDDDISIVTACLAVRFEARKVRRREGGGEEKGGEEEGGEDEAFVVSEASFCFGGVAATPLRAPRAARALVGTRWSLRDFERALRALTSEDVVIRDDAPGGAVPFRRALVASAFARFFSAAHGRLLEVTSGDPSLCPPPPLPSWLSAASEGLPPRPPPRSLQYWDEDEDESGREEEAHRSSSSSGGKANSSSRGAAVIGAPVRHLSAALQASGAARYVADEPLPPGTLHGALVLSTRAAARVARIDASGAVGKAGSSGGGGGAGFSSSSSSSSKVFFFGAADVPGTNRWGPFLGDPLFLGVGDRSEAVGLPLGIVVAPSEALARRTALLVEVEYDDESDGDDENDGDGRAPSPSSNKKKKKPILTIEDAIAAGSFFEGMDREIEHGEGDIDALFEGYRREQREQEEEEGKEGQAVGVGGGGVGFLVGGSGRRRVAVVEGSLRIGGQEHFYLEPHSALVVPGEPGTSAELDVLSSTQAPSGTQLDAARAAALPLHSVVCRATRLGGGFGGKETRAGGVAAAAAVAAVRTKRPVRLVLERHVDAAISGGVSSFIIIIFSCSFFRLLRGRKEVRQKKNSKHFYLSSFSLTLFLSKKCFQKTEAPLLRRVEGRRGGRRLGQGRGRRRRRRRRRRRKGGGDVVEERN